MNAVLAVIVQHAPPSYLVIVPALTFAIYFGGGLVLLQTGALKGDPADATELNVSPWFAWLLSGSLVAFLLGLIVVGGKTTGEQGLRAGGVAAGVWTGLVAIVWIVRRMMRAAA